MNKSKRTPYRVVKYGTGGLFEIWTRFDDSLKSRNNYPIAVDIVSKKDAVLLSSAPDLLEALKAMCEAYQEATTNEKRYDAFIQAVAAIAKAEGKA